MEDVDSLPEPEPIDAVLFDFHFTLVDQLRGGDWLQLAWERVGRDGRHEASFGQEESERLAEALDKLWDRAIDIDPASARDLSADVHREVFDRLLEAFPEIDEALAQALYETISDTWIPFAETLHVLEAIRARGVRTALVSNIALDVRPSLRAHGLDSLFDHIELSFEAGVVKPDAAIFSRALQSLAVAPERALMVGDNWRADAGAARLGVRTLILPRTPGFAGALTMVLALLS